MGAPSDTPGAAARAAEVCAHCRLPVRVAPDATPATHPRDAAELFCCLGCRLARSVAGGQGERGWLEARLIVSAFLAMGVMTFSLVLYAEDLLGPGAGLPVDAGAAGLRALGRWALALLSLPVLVLLGWPLLSGAVADLRVRRLGMDGLIVLAVGAAWILSVAHSLTGQGQVYFETATLVLVLVTFGRRLEAHARTRGRDAEQALAACLPAEVERREADGRRVRVTPAALRPGDLLHIAPGQALPADVRVREGRGEVVTAHVTGEQAPWTLTPGSEVPAGSLNGFAPLVVEVLRPAGAGTLGRLRELLQSPLGLTPAMRLADRWAGVLALAALVLAPWRSYGMVHAASPHEALGAALATGLSVLLVACPCALGLATPLAYRSLRAALARRGILVHDAGALERAARVDEVLLDKTGTVTEPAGRLEPRAAVGPDAQAHLAALVAASGHALASTVTVPTGTPTPEDVEVVPGGGVRGRLAGRVVLAGRPGWLDAEGARWPVVLAEAREAAERRGDTLVACAEDGAVTALGSVGQQLRPGAAQAVAALTARGVDVELLSGDRSASVATAAALLGVPGTGGLVPEDKHRRVLERRRAGRVVLMMGDGLNDAPALGAADVGVAPPGASDTARSRAAIELLGDDLGAVPVLLEGARHLRRTMQGNLTWTVVYNLVALGAATAGLLHPLLAVSAMIASSLAVSVRSWRLLGWQPADAGVAAAVRAPGDGAGRGVRRTPQAAAARTPAEVGAA